MPRVGSQPENFTERVALMGNLAPWPVVDSMWGPPLGRVVQVAARTGLFERLMEGPATVEQLAGELRLREPGTRLLVDCLTASGYLRARGEQVELVPRARKWLDPQSETSVLGFLRDNNEYWAWWAGLEELVRDGRTVEIHDYPPDHPYWRSYITGQFELARLSAPEVAKALRLPDNPTAMVDLAGAHGWFSAALCQRYPSLTATVYDLPGSVAVGRDIIARAGLSERVRHVEGDILSADLAGPYDLALAFNIIHHLQPEQIVTLFGRVHEVLRPGGSLAVLDLFTRPQGKAPDGSAYLGLFFHLTSGAETYSPEQLRGWLAQTGFGRPRRVRVRSLPSQTVYQAVRA